MKSDQVSQTNEWLNKLKQLKISAVHSNQRLLVVLNGEQQWVYELMTAVLEANSQENNLSIGEHSFTAALSVSHNEAEQYLGLEFDCIVYDTFYGLFPSTIAISEGTLKGGGLFFILAPDFNIWANSSDVFSQQYAMHPYTACDMSNLFITRFINLVKLDKDVTVISQNTAHRFANNQVASHSKTSLQGPCRTQDQQVAVDKILHSAKGHRNRPLVLLSNRGRGKSSALGIACALLVKDKPHHITITAPRKKSTHTLFSHINNSLSLNAHTNCYRIEFKQSLIEFIAPDELIRQPVKTNILLIDEAASIPLPLLELLLERYHRIVFASTVYGYEGNGRGFELKFLKYLQQTRPGTTVHELIEPIRWSQDDALERLFFKTFLLDSDYYKDLDETAVTLSAIQFSKLDKKSLLNDESTLKSLFGLLTHAHYKTTPNDLRMIIDSPYIDIYCAYYQDQIIAATLISAEGGIDEDFAVHIMDGTRRISGQFLPQTLVTEFSRVQDAKLKFARVMRIAVHPSLHRQGIGLALLNYVTTQLESSFDFMGAGFSSDEGVCHFWNRAGYMPVKIGHKKNAFSGQHSLVVIKGISTQSQKVIDDIRNQFPVRLLYLLTDSHKYLDSTLVRSLLVSFTAQTSSPLSKQEQHYITSFANSNRHFNTCAQPLYKLVVNCLHVQSQAGLSEDDWNILIKRLIQRQSETEVVKSCQLKGKNELLEKMRASITRLLACIKTS